MLIFSHMGVENDIPVSFPQTYPECAYCLGILRAVAKIKKAFPSEIQSISVVCQPAQVRDLKHNNSINLVVNEIKSITATSTLKNLSSDRRNPSSVIPQHTCPHFPTKKPT